MYYNRIHFYTSTTLSTPMPVAQLIHLLYQIYVSWSYFAVSNQPIIKQFVVSCHMFFFCFVFRYVHRSVSIHPKNLNKKNEEIKEKMWWKITIIVSHTVDIIKDCFCFNIHIAYVFFINLFWWKLWLYCSEWNMLQIDGKIIKIIQFNVPYTDQGQNIRLICLYDSDIGVRHSWSTYKLKWK